MKGAVKNLRDSMFRIIKDVVWDLHSGDIGIKKGENTYTLEMGEGENNYTLRDNPLQFFSLPIPAWATRVPISTLKRGDVVVLKDDTLVFFIEQAEKESQIRVLRTDGSASTVDVGMNVLLGQENSILCVRNILGTGGVAGQLPMLLLLMERGGDETDIGRILALSMLTNQEGGDGGGGGLNGMLPLLLMGGGGGGMSDMLPLLMLSQNGGGGDMNSLLPFLLLGKGGGDNKSLLLMLMMGGGLGGATGGEGEGDGGLFGGNSMLPLLLLGDGELDSKTLMLLMMMSQQNGDGENGLNPLMLMLLLGGLGGDDEDDEEEGLDSRTLMMMLMMQQGGNSILPLVLADQMGFEANPGDMSYDEDSGHWVDDSGLHYDYDGNQINENDSRSWDEDGNLE